MGKVKHTKNELKAQRDALQRFDRYLPMLQLKKQQLQTEIQNIAAHEAAKSREQTGLRDELGRWEGLFSEPVDLEAMIQLDEIQTDEGNIAGVRIPLFRGIRATRAEVDLFNTPAWVDDALDAIERLMALKAERDVLKEQQRLVEKELRTTSQRVNLFEKVKIPECRENIRVIRIFLGDEQTAAVVRGKIAKNRTEAAA